MTTCNAHSIPSRAWYRMARGKLQITLCVMTAVTTEGLAAFFAPIMLCENLSQFVRVNISQYPYDDWEHDCVWQ